MLKRFAQTCLILLLVVALLTTSVSAANFSAAIDISDMVSGITSTKVNGVECYKYVLVAPTSAVFDMYRNNDSQSYSNYGNDFWAVNFASGFTEARIVMYPLGVVQGYNNVKSDGAGVWDLAGFVSGSAINITMFARPIVSSSSGYDFRYRFIAAVQYYNSRGIYLTTDSSYTDFTHSGAGLATLTQSVSISSTIPSDAVYAVPVWRMYIWAETAGQTYDSSFSVELHTGNWSWSIAAPVAAVTAGLGMLTQQYLQSIDGKLDDVNDNLEDVGGKLDDTNDKLDDIIAAPDNERNEASSSGNDGVDSVTGAIPDVSGDFVGALEDLMSAMSYEGTKAKLPVPALNVPGIPGLFPGFTALSEQSLDFGAYIAMLPVDLLELVQSLLSMALVVYCVRDLYKTIAGLMVGGGGGDE